MFGRKPETTEETHVHIRSFEALFVIIVMTDKSVYICR